MKPPREPRASKRNTEENIIEVAERLYGQHGLEGVSFRQIGLAAGAANHTVVQYHFGDRAGLVRAIFARRLPSLEARRSQLLTEAAQAGRSNDPRALMEVLLKPIAEEKDRHGRRSYAAFLLGLHHSEPPPGPRMEADDLAPLTRHINELLSAALPHVPKAWFFRRLVNASILFLSALVDLDRRQAAGEASQVGEDAVLGDALDAATAALAAPLAQDLRRALQ